MGWPDSQSIKSGCGELPAQNIEPGSPWQLAAGHVIEGRHRHRAHCARTETQHALHSSISSGDAFASRNLVAPNSMRFGCFMDLNTFVLWMICAGQDHA
jgi:hypothetical protein